MAVAHDTRAHFRDNDARNRNKQEDEEAGAYPVQVRRRRRKPSQKKKGTTMHTRSLEQSSSKGRRSLDEGLIKEGVSNEGTRRATLPLSLAM